MKGLTASCALFSSLLFTLSAQAAPTAVCVDVQEKSWIQRGRAAPPQEGKAPEQTVVPETLPSVEAVAGQSPAPKSIIALEPQPPPQAHDPESVLPPPVASPPVAPPPPPAPPRGRAAATQGIDPAQYLKRLLEYQVTHDARYDAVPRGCAEWLKVELYALDRGWTVFARFSQFAREEKVDRVQLDEFGALADRLSRALLSDSNVQTTLNRENVLRADSQEDMRRVHSQAHFMLSLGTALRMGMLETAQSGGNIEESFRVSSPLTLSVGSRNKFRSWALDPFARVQLGMGKYVPGEGEPGGHADFGGSAALGLHFLRYANPPGIGSLYYGGGAHFEVARYAITKAGDAGQAGEHSGLWTGGLNMDLLLGYEFMRASSLHFFVQTEASMPAYTVDGRTSSGGIDNAYLPSIVAQVGLLL